MAPIKVVPERERERERERDCTAVTDSKKNRWFVEYDFTL
jgi:hypothetical protein